MCISLSNWDIDAADLHSFVENEKITYKLHENEQVDHIVENDRGFARLCKRATEAKGIVYVRTLKPVVSNPQPHSTTYQYKYTLTKYR